MFWYFSALSCVLPALLGFIYKSRFSKSYQPLVYVLILAFFTELLAILSELIEIPILKSSAYNVYIIVSYALFLYFFVLLKVYQKNIAATFFLIVVLSNIIELMIIPRGNIMMFTSIFESIVITMGCLKIISQEIFTKGLLYHSFLSIVAFSTIVLSLFDIFNSIIGYIVTLPYTLKYNISIIYKTVNALYYLVLTFAFYRLIWKNKLSQ